MTQYDYNKREWDRDRVRVMREIAESLRREAVRAQKRRAPGVMAPVECILHGEDLLRAAEAYDRAADEAYLNTYNRAVA